MFNKDLYNQPYHDIDLSTHTFLITGGAGFIGSNLVEYLLKYNAGHVRVLDNLSNGYFENIKEFIKLPNFEFIEGDIRDLKTCKKAVDGIDFISHQAALGSVPRSISNPIITNDVNISGFLNVLQSGKESKQLKKMVYAASSSTYGDNPNLPKIEGNEGNPLSPYAVTKLVNEIYAKVYSKVYNFNTIGLRYFNAFGPKQNPNNPYAAVIPLFCKNIYHDEPPKIFGDGLTSRDFTFIENIIQANIITLTKSNIKKSNEVFNVATGSQVSLLKLVDEINLIANSNIKPVFLKERIGDIKHSKASILKIKKIGFDPLIKFEDGLKITYEWYTKNIFNNE